MLSSVQQFFIKYTNFSSFDVTLNSTLTTIGPSIIVNVKLSVQFILFRGKGGQWKKHIDSVHFQHFSPFIIIFMANNPFEK